MYNFARPKPNCVWVNGKERVFERLLSISESDRTNIFNFSEIVSENGEPVIVYYDHESAFEYEDYEPQFVCSSFRELLDSITESQEE